MNEQKIKNPIIPGFYPDPSICRAGDDFYLVCSSFELFPGIPVFHSRNLADWEQIGYVMDEYNGFNVVANTYNGGVMAPTIRYHDGLFYVINMNFSDKGNYIVTAKNPAGPWSQPIWLTDVQGLDASLFFDDDGKAYIVGLGQVVERPDGSKDNGIWLRELDLRNMQLVGETSVIWDSALRVGKFPESPHIYKVNGWYHLVIAEGGTEYYHSVVTARSRELRGWYEGNPGNPVMSHRQLGRRYPLHNIGHADLVETPSGKWYAVMLGSRPVAGLHYNLGRETFLCPVAWEEDWPIFSPGTGKIEWEYDADTNLPPVGVKKKEQSRDGFDQPKLGLEWSLWGTPGANFWTLANSRLKLKCLPRGISEPVHGYNEVDVRWQREHNISLVGRRQLHRQFAAACKMSFTPAEGETAGIAVIQAMNHQFRFERACEACVQLLRLVLVTTETNTHAHLPGFRAETSESVVAQVPWENDEIVLRVTGNEQWYSFFYGTNEDSLALLYENADSTLLNPASIGTFTGMLLGMFASGNGRESNNQADFDWFQYDVLLPSSLPQSEGR